MSGRSGLVAKRLKKKTKTLILRQGVGLLRFVTLGLTGLKALGAV
jgi:hypothetical protein